MKDINYLKENGVDVDKSLELFGDIETYNDTLVEFQNGIDGKLSQIDKYFKDGDMPNYAIYVHSLKSDSKYFGFLKLAELSYEHEMKSKANDYAFVKDNYDELVKEANKVKAIVSEYLGTTSMIYGDEDNSSTEDVDSLQNDIILVADDSEVVRVFVKKIFENQYELASAKNGEEALNIIKEHLGDNRIKAILLDLNMPVVDGFAVLDYLKTNDLFSKMPVTIISGDSSSEAINKAFNYDIVDMLNKPFNENKIKEVVLKTINKKGN